MKYGPSTNQASDLGVRCKAGPVRKEREIVGQGKPSNQETSKLKVRTLWQRGGGGEVVRGREGDEGELGPSGSQKGRKLLLRLLAKSKIFYPPIRMIKNLPAQLFASRPLAYVVSQDFSPG